MIRFSVITPVLNGKKFIRETIESVLSQKGDFELEYIVKDGGSKDRTLDILNEYTDKCKIISINDSSPQDAINQGMKLASGDIGCWLNADDLYLPGAFQKVVDVFKKNPEAQWCYGRCKIIDENGKEIRKPITQYKDLLGYFYSKNILLTENYINQPATFWKIDFWKSLPELSPTFKAAWDYERWLQMAEHAAALPIHSYLAAFRRHKNSISENYFRKQFQEELEITRLHGNQLHYIFHKFNSWKTIKIYNILRKYKETVDSRKC